MTDIEEAVRRLRGLKERVDRLEGQREGEGAINIFRTVSDRTNTSDTVTTTEGNPADFTWVERYDQGDTLTVAAGDTVTISSGDTRTEDFADIDGTLQVDGTLNLEAQKRDFIRDTSTLWGFEEWQNTTK